MNILKNIMTKVVTGETAVSGAFKNGSAIAKASFSDYFNKLLSVKSKLEDRVTYSKNAAVSMLLDSDIYGDVDVDLDISNLDFVTISDDTFEMLRDNVFGNTFVNSDGYPVEFMSCNENFEGVTVLCKTQTVIYSDKDIFIYQKDGEYFANPKVRSLGYWRQDEHEYVPPIAIYDCLLELADLLEVTLTDNDIQSMARDISEYYGTASGTTISDYVTFMAEEAGTYDPDNVTILHQLQQLCYNYGSVYNDNYGAELWIADLARDIVKSAELNECINDAADNLLQGCFDVPSFMTRWEASEATYTFRDNITRAYQIGGVIGAIKMIFSYLNAFDNATDQYGALTLSNNNDFIGKEYVSGMVLTIIGSVISLAGALVTMLAPVIGVGISLVGTALTAIPQAVNYDYKTATTASVTDNDKTVNLPFSPLVSAKGSITISAYMGTDLYDYLSHIGEDNPVTLFYVPGGAIIIGLNPEDSTKLNWEFHPGFIVIDKSKMGLGDVTVWTNTSIHSSSAWWATDGQDVNLNLNSLNQAYFLGTPIDITNNDEGVLSAEDDEKLRGIIIRNAYIFRVFATLLASKYNNTYGYLSDNDISYFKGIDSGVPYTTGSGDDYWREAKWRESLSLFMSPADIVVDQDIMSPSDRWFYGKGWNDVISLFNTLCNDKFNESEGILHEYYNLDLTGAPSAVFDNADEVSCAVWNQSITLSAMYMTILICENEFLGDTVPLSFNYNWGHLTPKYNKSTFILWTSLAIATVALAAIATVVIKTKWKRFRTQKQLENAAKTEQAWSKVVNTNGDPDGGPTQQNLKAYRKAVLKNNLFASISDGTKYSKYGFWGSTESNEQGGVKKSLFNKMSSALTQSASVSAGEEPDMNAVLQQIIASTNEINHNITGN